MENGLPPVLYSGNGGANENTGEGGMHFGDVSSRCMRNSSG